MRSMHWSNSEEAISMYILRKGYNKPFIRWLDRLIVMGVISVEDWDREAGKFFGYPDCCIKWFIFMGKMGILRIGSMMDYLYGHTSCGYVLCPKCKREELKKYGTNYPRIHSRKVRMFRQGQ